MKILHTADWHAGRALHGIDRTPEIREALDEVVEAARREAVDLVVAPGDLFDTRNPGAAAEEAVYGFFTEMGAAGIPVVAIAGNHDSPQRLDAASDLLRLAGARVLGAPRVAGAGGAFALRVGGEEVRIAALPFVSERRLVKVAELLEGDVGEQRRSYRASMRKLIANLAAGFRPDAVNLLLLHGTMEGATLANSEYAFQSQGAYVLDADVLPAAASYVALGHVHKAQTVQGMPGDAARYCGSLLQLDFGERGDAKSLPIVELRPGRPAEVVEELPVRAGRRLVQVRADEGDLDRRLADLEGLDAWVKVTVRLDEPRPGLKDRIRSALPHVLVVEVELPEAEGEARAGVDLERVTLREAYARYHEERRGAPPSERAAEAFRELLEAAEDPDGDAPLPGAGKGPAAPGDETGGEAETGGEVGSEADVAAGDGAGDGAGDETGSGAGSGRAVAPGAGEVVR